MEYRAQKAPAIGGKLAWYGQRRADEHEPWRTASSQYGKIRYMSPEAAIAGAKVYTEPSYRWRA